MNPSLNLSRAEINGLIQYISIFEDEVVPRMACVPRRQGPSDGFVCDCVVDGRFKVVLERLWDNDWEGSCTCMDGMDCTHCLGAAACILGMPPGLPAKEYAAQFSCHGAPGARAAINPRDDIAALAAKALGRELSREEQAYVGVIREVAQRMISRYVMSVADFMRLAQCPGAGLPVRTNPFHVENIPLVRVCPSMPENCLDFYHGIARLLLVHGFHPAAFLAETLRQNPPPKSWIHEWDVRDEEAWRLAMDPVELPSDPPPRAAPGNGTAHGTLGMRIHLAPDGPDIEVRFSETEPWRGIKRTDLARVLRSVRDLALDAEPASAALVHRLTDWVLGVSKPELRYEAGRHGPGDSAIATFLRSPAIRACMLCPDRSPVPVVLPETQWRLVPTEFAPEGQPTHYSLEVAMADGSPVPRAVAHADGNPGWLIAWNTVIRMPRRPEKLPYSDHIPARFLETEQGIRFLSAIGAVLPDNLEKRVRRVPLKPSIQFKLSGEPGSERIIAAPVALDPSSQRVVEKRNIGGWQPSKGPGRKAKNAPAADQPIVIHDRSKLHALEDALERLKGKWEGYPNQLTLRVTKRFPAAFHEWVQSLPPDVDLKLPPELAHFTQPPVEAQFQLHVAETSLDWFDLSTSLTTSDSDLTPEELQLLLDAEGGFVNLPGKGWRRVRVCLSPEDQQHLAELGLEASSISSEPIRLHALQLANPAAKRLLPESHAAQVQRRAEEIQARVTPPVPDSIQASLRPYQLEGFHFLAYLSQNRFGGVLADDMGLGKTVQTLTWIGWLRSQPVEPMALPDPSRPGADTPRHVLIVCPKSVLPNWIAEARRFLPSLRIAAWSGPDAESLKSDLEGHDALVVNYAQLRLLEADLAARTWLAVILDEAQYIKNPDSQTAQAARALPALHRLALTGTPIENRLLDLWSILAFAMPGALGPRARFNQSFSKDDPLARRRLAARLRPFLLRRTKGQVAQDLPERIEEDVLCELEGTQKTLYSAEYKKARALLLGLKTSADLDKFRFHFLTSLLRLRQICCHAALVDPKHRRQPSAKLEALIDLVEPLLSQGLKVLVFSQFTYMIDILKETLEAKGTTTFILTGETENRGPLVDSFNQHEGAAAFLISLKAGGFGLNLTSASYVVLFDPWWNPAVENQAIDRTHRIGQKKTVFAYRLIVQGSIEEKIRRLQSSKSALAQDILGEERFSQSLTLDDFRFLFESPEAPV